MDDNNNKKSNVYKPNVVGFVLAAVVLVLIAAIVVMIIIMVFSNKGEDGGGQNNDKTPAVTTTDDSKGQTDDPVGDDTDDPVKNETTADDGKTDPSTDPGVNASEIKVATNQVYYGPLILVNAENTYKKDKSMLIGRTAMSALSAPYLLLNYNFKNVYGSTGGNYTIRSSTGYYLDVETLDHFNEMMAAFVGQTGHKDVQVRNAYYYDSTEDVCVNATGLVVDLQIYTDKGKIYPLKYTPLKAEYYDWFVDNCHKYGFIHTRDVKSSTGEELYSSFRYIGVAHASYITANGLTHEAYIDLIKGYKFENRLTFKLDDTEWWIYYVPGTGEETTIKVIGDSYSVSGNNIDGFVVAVNASQLGK